MLSDLQKRTVQGIVNLFETGRLAGDCGRVTLHPDDPGHLTYGRSQTTLASGNLHLLVKDYCEAEGARFGAELGNWLDRLEARDLTLDLDGQLRMLLADAGRDPVMERIQDGFFDRVYWVPSLASAEWVGVASALGMAAVYDGRIHGSWHAMRDRTIARHGPISRDGGAGLDEATWIARYVEERRAWLAGHSNRLLRKTVYRMDALRGLINEGRWNLELPFRLRGVSFDEGSLSGEPPVVASAEDETPRLLRLRRPMMAGEDVRALQAALNESAGAGLAADGLFGRVTGQALRLFQSAYGLKADGIAGPATRAALSL